MSGFYDTALQDFTGAGINLSSDTIKVRLLRKSGYTFSSANTIMSNIGAGVTGDVTLGSKALSGGTFDAADAVFTAVPSGAAIDSLVVFKFGTSDADSVPIAYIDGFSVTPNGGDITIQWQGTTPFIFKI